MMQEESMGMKKIVVESCLMDYPLEAVCTVLNEGIHVLLTGGSRTHVGAISYIFPGETAHTVEFPGHRDGIVSKKWATDLCRQSGTYVVVNCGIHYDGVNRQQIDRIVEETEVMLVRLEAMLKEEGCYGV